MLEAWGGTLSMMAGGSELESTGRAPLTDSQGVDRVVASRAQLSRPANA